MDEQLTELYHEVRSTKRGLSIWWIDDCFYKRSKFGSFLPIDVVREGKVSVKTHHASAMVYKGLDTIAEDHSLGFWVCSFEYAEAHWRQLNTPGNIILIDVGYEEVDNLYGINLYYRLTSGSAILAECAYLTVDPSQALAAQAQRRFSKPEVIEKTGDSLPGVPDLESGVRAMVTRALLKAVMIAPRDRLWPTNLRCWVNPDPGWTDEDASVAWWFNDARIKHNVTRADSEVNFVKRYLHNLFTIPPPDDWFTDPNQYGVLAEVLKSLVGACAVANGGSKYNLILGGAILVLAAATGRHAQHWLKGFVWKVPGQAILPIAKGKLGYTQTRLQAETAILALWSMFEEFACHKETEAPLVESVVMPTGNKLSIVLDFNASSQLSSDRFKEKANLLEKLELLRPAGGNLYSSYLDFLACSAWTNVGRMSFCNVNIWLDGAKTRVELVSCRP